MAVFLLFASCTERKDRPVKVTINDESGTEIVQLTGTIVTDKPGTRYYLKFAGDDGIRFGKIATKHRGEALVFSLDGIGRCKWFVDDHMAGGMMEITTLLSGKDQAKTFATKEEAVEELLSPFGK